MAHLQNEAFMHKYEDTNLERHQYFQGFNTAKAKYGEIIEIMKERLKVEKENSNRLEENCSHQAMMISDTERQLQDLIMFEQ